MASRSGGAPIRTNKVRSGPDQAFTLPKGTSAAPIKGKGMGVKKVDIIKKHKKEIAKLQAVLDKSAKSKAKTLRNPGAKKPSNASRFVERRKQLRGAGNAKGNTPGTLTTYAVGVGAGSLGTAFGIKKSMKKNKKKREK